MVYSLLKGNLSFSSAGLGCGCTFYFELPLYPHTKTPETFEKLPNSEDNVKPSLQYSSNRKQMLNTMQETTVNTSHPLNNEFTVATMEENDHVGDHLHNDQYSCLVMESTRSTSRMDSNINFHHVFHQLLRQKNYQGKSFAS